MFRVEELSLRGNNNGNLVVVGTFIRLSKKVGSLFLSSFLAVLNFF